MYFQVEKGFINSLNKVKGPYNLFEKIRSKK